MARQLPEQLRDAMRGDYGATINCDSGDGCRPRRVWDQDGDSGADAYFFHSVAGSNKHAHDSFPYLGVNLQSGPEQCTEFGAGHRGSDRLDQHRSSAHASGQPSRWSNGALQ
jgi:hypothetical protein